MPPLTISNEVVKLKLSGNYAIVVCEDYDWENIILIEQFYVVDNKTQINANAKIAADPMFMATHQEVDFNLICNFDVTDAHREIQVVLMQNFNPHTAITNLSPKYINGNVLDYNYEKENLFAAGNEFKHFEIKNYKYPDIEVDSIYFVQPYFYFELLPDEVQKRKPYSYNKELNGKFFIECTDCQNSHTDANYGYANFKLPFSLAIGNSSVYVFGALSNWQIDEHFKLKYDTDKRLYKGDILLKPGHYDYQYVVLDNSNGMADYSYIDGNHYETENDYIFLVYYRDLALRYDQLVGYEVINSLE